MLGRDWTRGIGLYADGCFETRLHSLEKVGVHSLERFAQQTSARLDCVVRKPPNRVQ